MQGCGARAAQPVATESRRWALLFLAILAWGCSNSCEPRAGMTQNDCFVFGDAILCAVAAVAVVVISRGFLRQISSCVMKIQCCDRLAAPVLESGGLPAQHVEHCQRPPQ